MGLSVLLVNRDYPPGGGGAEIHVRAVARALAGSHRVTVLVAEGDPGRPDHVLREESREGVRLVALNNLHREAPGFEAYRDPGAAGAAARVLDRERPDVVHVHGLHGLSTGLVFEARRRGIAVVLTLHDFWPACPLGQLLDRRERVCPGPEPVSRCLGCVGGQLAPGLAPLRRLARSQPGATEAPPAPAGLAAALAGAAASALARLAPSARRRLVRRREETRAVLAAADALLSPSRFLASRLAALGFPRAEVLANGHEPLAASPRRADPAGRVRFGFLGAAIPSKGLHVLARAFRRLDDPRAALRVHGSFPPYHGDRGYERRVRAVLGPAAEEALRGPYPAESTAEVLSGLDVLVVPSLWEENAPLVVEEGFLTGLPPVVSGHGGLAERVRDGVDGLHFRPGDDADLARVLRRMLDEPGLAARLAAAAPPVPTAVDQAAALAGVYERARERVARRAGRVGVVVVDRGRPGEAARAVLSASDPALSPRLLVVENGPEVAVPGGVETLALGENRGFAAGANAGIRHLAEAGCDRVLLLNNDARLEVGSLRLLAEALEDPRLGAVGPVVLRADGRVESRGMELDGRSGRHRLLGHGEPDEPRQGPLAVPALSGAALLLRVEAFSRAGAFDEAYFHGFEDADWCERARRAGWALAVVLGARAHHQGSLTLGQASPERLYYAARNHLRALDALHPRGSPASHLRRLSVVALNLAHALRQGDVPRLAGLRAVLAGASDHGAGRDGPARSS